MPICIPNSLPAAQVLESENVFVMSEERASHQDIRPLKIGILNLMPTKIVTETQLLRLLSNTPLQVDIELLQTATHTSKNTSAEHLLKFYKTFADIQKERFDGFIITGAPVEQMPFEEVDYWDELCRIMDYTKENVYSTIHLCWGALAGLYYHFGIPKYPLAQKMFGIFPHVVEVEHSLLLKGFDECFYVPHSRNTEVRRADIEQVSQLEILTSSPMSGVHIVANKNGRQYFITGHSEYDRDTIAQEYFRDRDKGIDIQIPYHYFPEDDPTRTPRVTWRCHANLMFSNWLNYCVYQRTPYNLDELSVRNWEWEIGI